MGIGELGVAFGLFMAGVSRATNKTLLLLLTDFFSFQFSGHAVIPSIARDMAEPHLFDTAMNYAFVSYFSI